MAGLIDWLRLQIEGPGTLAGLLMAFALLCGMALPVRLWRAERRQRRRAALREAEALAALADHGCDLVIVVADAFRDEVNAEDFREGFDRRQLIDADLMLEAVPINALPSLGLLRPLFELRWAVERSAEIAEWLPSALDDPERAGWREAADEVAGLAESAAVAAESFRNFVREVRRS